jgi:hypothetical protein
MAFKQLPLGHKPPGFQHPQPRRPEAKRVPGSGGKPVGPRKLALVAAKRTDAQAKAASSMAVASKRVQPLGQPEINKAMSAEALHAQIKAKQAQALGTTKGPFATKNGNTGRPAYRAGMHDTVIVQPLTSPYRSRFTFGAPKF